MRRANGPSLAALAAGAAARVTLRGEPVLDYLLGSLVYCARHPADLPGLVPRALGWYRHLASRDIRLPFGLVLDLGYVLLEGEDFHFRDYFADRRLPPAERDWREAYEQAVVLRRLRESAGERLRQLLQHTATADEALVLALELLLEPVAATLSQQFEFELAGFDLPAFNPADLPAHLHAFEAAIERPGVVAAQLREVVAQAGWLDLDQRLAAEDFYELEHIRVFPRASLREVARGIKRTERLLGTLPAVDARRLRERALARTTLDSVGTYPVGGIAELGTRGPLENLAASELLYLEPEAELDLFGLRLVEDELLRWQRDGAALHLLRRRYVFVVDESDALFGPVTVGDTRHGLRGVKLLRCLLGLVLALVGDLARVFGHDDARFDLVLVQPEGSTAALATDRREVAEVLRLLLAEREATGTARVEVSTGTVAETLRGWRPETDRAGYLVALAPSAALAPNEGWRPPPGLRYVGQPVRVGAEPPTAGAIDVTLDPVGSLRAARLRLLGALFA
ncbi:MAG TPA: hypothetical protein DCZ72_15430 [Armatimonadetes bacterium]|nr:hypothetical protein [Armatimonadota bacterium]